MKLRYFWVVGAALISLLGAGLAAHAQGSISLATYRSGQYSILYPSTWGITDRGNGDTYFGQAATPVCNQPGMSVATLGEATAGLTPDNYLEQYAASASVQASFESEKINIRRIGRSMRYTQPCADGSMRQYRVTMYVAYGRAYRVLQFAPQDQYPTWEPTFLAILNAFGPTTANTASAGGGGVAIQPPNAMPLANIVHTFAGNVYVGTLGDLPGKAITMSGSPSRSYRHARPAPRSDLISFVDPNTGTLYIASSISAENRVLAEGVGQEVLGNYPPAWSPSGDEMVFVSAGNPPLLMGVALTGKIWQMAPLPAESCPAAASFDPADQLYRKEADSYTLFWGRNNQIYFSLPCGKGLATVNSAGGDIRIINSEIRRAYFHPDESEVIGIVDQPVPTLTVLRMADGKTTPLLAASNGASPDIAGWSADGKFMYYSILAPGDRFSLEDASDEERIKAFFGGFPVQAETFAVALFRLELATGISTEVYQGTGRGIGTITASPDSTGILFTMISGSAPLLEAFSNNVSVGELVRLAPTSQILWLAGEAPPQLVAISSDPHWAFLGSAPVPTPTGGARTALPMPTPTIPPTWTPISDLPAFTASAVPTQATMQPSPAITRSAPPTNTPRPRP
jgi:hypothetical protein